MYEDVLAARLARRLRDADLGPDSIGLPALWPTLVAWLSEPVPEVPADEDWIAIYLAMWPRGTDGGFAGAPPDALADRDLVALEFGRRLERRIDPIESEGLSQAGLTLWYAADPAWSELRSELYWTGEDPMTPSLDYQSEAEHRAEFVPYFEAKPVFAIGCRLPVLALAADLGDEERFEVFAPQT